jgi:hypothetical protein
MFKFAEESVAGIIAIGAGRSELTRTNATLAKFETFGVLIKLYRSDPRSGFAKLKYGVRKAHAKMYTKIDQQIGEVSLNRRHGRSHYGMVQTVVSRRKAAPNRIRSHSDDQSFAPIRRRGPKIRGAPRYAGRRGRFISRMAIKRAADQQSPGRRHPGTGRRSQMSETFARISSSVNLLRRAGD